MRIAAILLAGLLTIQAALAGDVEHPPKGSPARAEILDAARPIFAAETSGPIEFVVTTLNVFNGWAYADVMLQRPGGVAIDWNRTKFAEDWRQGMHETAHNLVLLKYGGTGWRVIEYAIGPTDVAWVDWVQQYNLPEILFTAE